MNELQRNRLMSHKSVLEVLAFFQFIWNENKAVNEVVAELEANLKKIEETIEMHLDSTEASEKQQKGANLLNALFEEMDDLLTSQLDKLLLRYALSHADFFYAYGDARTVKNYGLGYGAMRKRDSMDRVFIS